MPTRGAPQDPFSRMLEQVGMAREERVSHVRLRPVGNPAFPVQFTDDARAGAASPGLSGLYADELVYEAEGLPAGPPSNATDADTIARELGLSRLASEAELQRARRTFALANHPDRLDPLYRDVATSRMMVANRLIDDALGRLA